MAIADRQASTQEIEVCLPQLARGVLKSAEKITSIHLKNHTCDTEDACECAGDHMLWQASNENVGNRTCKIGLA